MYTYHGVVKDIEDPLKIGRIRVEIPEKTSGIDIEMLPFYYPTFDKNSLDLPKLEEIVMVDLFKDDIHLGRWKRFNNPYQVKLSDDDYKSAKILLYRDLSENDDEGIIDISYIKSIGLRFSFKGSEITIRPDKTIFVKDIETGIIVHVNEGISLGSENKSAEPGVLGDHNHQALDMINDSIKELHTLIQDNMKKIKTISQSSPYTTHLVAPIMAFVTAHKQKTQSLYDKMKDFFPKTKSKIVSLD